MKFDLTQEFWDSDGFALFDTGAACCIVCEEFLGFQLNARETVNFNFEYIPIYLHR